MILNQTLVYLYQTYPKSCILASHATGVVKALAQAEGGAGAVGRLVAWYIWKDVVEYGPAARNVTAGG